MIKLLRFLDWTLGKREYIHSGADYVYLERWLLFSLFGTKTYLHRFLAPDGSRHMHDHPKRFISIGIWGEYIEEVPGPAGSGYRWSRPLSYYFSAPWIRSFPAEHIHRIAWVQNCWTICIVLKHEREWGFWVDSQWIPWRRYVRYMRAGLIKQTGDDNAS